MYKTNVLKEILKDGLKSKNLVSSEIFLRFIFRKKKKNSLTSNIMHQKIEYLEASLS